MLALLHARYDGLDNRLGKGQVWLHRIQIVGWIRIQGRAGWGTTGIVHEDVDFTPVLQEFTDASSGVFPAVEVACDPCMPLFGGNRQGISNFRQCFGTAGQEGDMGSISSQLLGAGPANTLSRSAYDGSSAFKWECHGTYTSRQQINFAEGSS